MKLIDKDRIVAEIENLLDKGKYHGEYDCAYRDGNNGALYALKGKLNTLEAKELPIWEKVSPDTGQTTLYKDGDESYLERFGYRIDLKELDKLPKNNSTHRTPADIEAAMQEVEEKSEAYTNAHRGERADDVLSQMRGEPVSEDLDEAAEEEASKYLPIEPGEAIGADGEICDQILNCNATLLRTFELGKIEMKHQILKAMDLGEPPYLISVEKAYYDVKKLLEDEV